MKSVHSNDVLSNSKAEDLLFAMDIKEIHLMTVIFSYNVLYNNQNKLPCSHSIIAIFNLVIKCFYYYLRYA